MKQQLATLPAAKVYSTEVAAADFPLTAADATLLPPHLQGPASSYSLRRTFGQAGEPRVKLYRDHAAWCP